MAPIHELFSSRKGLHSSSGVYNRISLLQQVSPRCKRCQRCSALELSYDFTQVEKGLAVWQQCFSVSPKYDIAETAFLGLDP